jgi:hypothetical protein
VLEGPLRHPFSIHMMNDEKKTKTKENPALEVKGRKKDGPVL